MKLMLRQLKRVRVVVAWSKTSRVWKITSNTIGVDALPTRARAVQRARKHCLDLLAVGVISELLIRNRRTGEWSTEGSTYGRDPRKTKG